jgi:redox-sensitive bicupin YhaK (pirin superfamily)
VKRTDDDLLILSEENYRVLGERDFGMPGLRATESIGPFVQVQASGPLIMVHDALVEPRLGIGHHPHRFNERLFYILRGQLDHDDALNGITGHMGPGDLARLTEGQTGMYHKEWNNGEEQTRAFILVYATDPVPARASFAALRDEEAPRYDEAPGVRTKELIGSRSPLEIHGDIRFYTDSAMGPDARIDVEVAEDEAAMLVPLEGSFAAGDSTFQQGQVVLVPPDGRRSLTVTAASPARLLRIVHGAGDGITVGQPLMR